MTPAVKRAYDHADKTLEMTGGGAEGILTARLMSFLNLMMKRKERFSQIADHVAKHYPDIQLSTITLILLTGFAENDRQMEIIASNVALRTLVDGEVISATKLLTKMLVSGYPSPEYMKRLEEYYEKHPEDLWPPLVSPAESPSSEGADVG
jgi:hypothetical protein